MQASRRNLIRGVVGGLGVASILSPEATAQESEVSQVGLYRPGRDFRGPQIETDAGFSTMGARPSRHAEIRTAVRLLFGMPRDADHDHMRIARYFADITEVNPEAVNAAGQAAKYNEEWVGVSNPLIVAFFSMTNTEPGDGDATHWCAAFVSFVLNAANKPNKWNALSGAYRDYGAETTAPNVGDLVVFRRRGDAGDRGRGHVGFYVGESGDRISVLGGNQQGHTGSTGAVTVSDYPRAGGGLQLHSFRRVPT